MTRVGVSDAQLRAHCEDAVRDELQTGEAQVQAALSALRRACEVVEASRELLKAPAASSPRVADALASVERCSNEVAPLVRKLRRAVYAAGGHESSSSTEEEPFFSVKEEPGVDVESDEASLDESIKLEDVSTARASTGEARARRTHRHRQEDAKTPARTARAPKTRRSRRESESSAAEGDAERRSSGRKRKAPERYLTPLPYLEMKKVSKQEMLEDRLVLRRQGKLGKRVRSCLLAVQEGNVPNVVQTLLSTCRAIADEKRSGGDVTSFMDDVEVALGVAVPAIDKYDGRLERNDLRAIQLLLESLPREFQRATKLRKIIASRYETPADEVAAIRKRLDKMLKEVREWCGGDVNYSVAMFEERLEFVKETMKASSFEGGYEPHWDKTIAELLFRLGCCLNVFETGWAQDRRYDTIRSLLYDMKSADRSKR